MNIYEYKNRVYIIYIAFTVHNVCAIMYNDVPEWRFPFYYALYVYIYIICIYVYNISV